MIKVNIPEEEFISKLLPAIFIESVELEQGFINIFYSFFINQDLWTNENILKETNVVIKINENVILNNMLDIKLNSQVKNNKIIKKITFPFNQQDLILECFSENKFITSTKNKETILIDNIIQKVIFDDKTYQFVNKIKNLKLLNINFSKNDLLNINGSSLSKKIEEAKKNINNKNLFISYTVDKKANVGFIFNLENFLISKSNIYNVLSANPNFKEKILANTKINTEKSYFYKKNISLNNKEYLPFANPTFKKADKLKEYFITATDNNLEKADLSKYKIKIKLIINNYSDIFLNNETKEKLSNTINFLKEYKNIFELIEKNNAITDANIFIFENEWQQSTFLDKVKKTIEILTGVSYLFSEQDDQKLHEIFISILHPLTTRAELLERLLNLASSYQTALNSILSAYTDFGTAKNFTTKQSELEFELEFDERDENNIINYNYEQNYGFEVINSTARVIRNNQQNQGIIEFNNINIELRKKLENLKYFNTSNQLNNATNTFALSFLELGEKSFDFLTSTSTITNNFYKDAFLRLNQYVNHNFNYRKLESFFYQLAEDNILVKTISLKNNNSVNNLRKSVLFDPNLDSQQASLEFISSTGLENFYYNIYKEKINIIQNNSLQYSASLNLVQGQNSSFIFSGSNDPKIDNFPKGLFFYNSIFQENTLYTNEYLQLIKVTELNVNPLFKNKLKHFNEYYLKIIGTPQVTPVIENVFSYEDDILLNVPARCLNRELTESQINVSLE